MIDIFAILTVQDNAKKLDNLIWEITDLVGLENGYDWFDALDTPLGEAWRDYSIRDENDEDLTFDEFLIRDWSPEMIAQEASRIEFYKKEAEVSIESSIYFGRL